MIIQLFIGVIALAAASLMVTQSRRRKIWSVFLLAGLGIFFYFFMINLNQTSAQSFIYQWLPYDLIKADLSISASARVQKILSYLAIMLVSFVYLNTVYKEEKHSLHVNTLLLLNFVGIILLISSHDFLQLMFADCMIFLISFYFMDDPVAKKNLFVFNFLSEMVIFTALALVYGETNSISLSHLNQYEQTENYKNLMALMLTLAIGCKCGLFLLNGHYYTLKNSTTNRLGELIALFIPLTGIVMAVKLNALIKFSPLSVGVIEQWSIVSCVFSLLSAVINRNIKTRMIALCLSIYAFSLCIIFRDPNQFYTLIPFVLIIISLLTVMTIITEIGTSGEQDITKLGHFWYYTKLNFILTLACFGVVILTLSSFLSQGKAVIFSGMWLSAGIIFIKLIYLGKSRADEKSKAFANNVNVLYWLPILCACCWLFGYNKANLNSDFYKLVILGIIVLLAVPSKLLIKISCLPVNTDEFLIKAYKIVFLFPLKALGRILWLLFDVVMIERNVIGSISTMTEFLVANLHYLQKIDYRRVVISALLGIAILTIYCWRYVYE